MNAHVDRALAGGVVLLMLGAALRVRGIQSREFAVAPDHVPMIRVLAPLGRDSLERMVADAIGRTPFRLVARDREESGEVVPDAPAEERTPTPPSIRLKAVVGGPPWQAVITDVPGFDGDHVIRTGDRIGDVVIVSIRTLEIGVSWGDTTWVVRLEARSP